MFTQLKEHKKYCTYFQAVSIIAIIMFGVLGFLPAYIVSKIMAGMGILRIPAKAELQGLDHHSEIAYQAAVDDVTNAERELAAAQK